MEPAVRGKVGGCARDRRRSQADEFQGRPRYTSGQQLALPWPSATAGDDPQDLEYDRWHRVGEKEAETLQLSNRAAPHS